MYSFVARGLRVGCRLRRLRCRLSGVLLVEIALRYLFATRQTGPRVTTRRSLFIVPVWSMVSRSIRMAWFPVASVVIVVERSLRVTVDM